MDVLVVNLAVPAPSTPVTEVTDTEWRHTSASLVDPLPRLFRAVLPQMIERRAGKILVMGSASALRGMRRTSTYSAARGAQLAYVQSVGVADSPGEKEQCAGGGLQAGAAVEFRRQHGCGNSIGYRVGVWRLDERRGWAVV